MLKVYRIQKGTIKEIQIVNYLSAKMGFLPTQLGNTHAWHCDELNYAVGFEGENQRGLRVKTIYVNVVEEKRQTTIKRHLESLCTRQGLSLK